MIDAQAAQRCPTCGGTPIESIPPALMAAEQNVVPRPPGTSPIERDEETGRNAGEKGDDKGAGPGLPDVDPQDLDPGSVADPGGPLLPGTQNTGSGAIGGLVDGLTGGGDPDESPSVPVLSDLIDGVDRILQGVVDPLTGQTETRQRIR
jgi:hypothetical protein